MVKRLSSGRQRGSHRVVDETFYLAGRRRGAILRQEVWSEEGRVVKYNLAYIEPLRSSKDNGRVLGYDSAHGQHHRHFRGEVEKIAYPGYEALLVRFQRELEELWREEDEKR